MKPIAEKTQWFSRTSSLLSLIGLLFCFLDRYAFSISTLIIPQLFFLPAEEEVFAQRISDSLHQIFVGFAILIFPSLQTFNSLPLSVLDFID